jgi:hypothetical protein
MIKFVVAKQGVYIQSILGVFNSLDKAELCAKYAASLEDDYHRFCVYEFEENVPLEPEPEDEGFFFDNRDYKMKLVG